MKNLFFFPGQVKKIQDGKAKEIKRVEGKIQVTEWSRRMGMLLVEC
jgi:hypothetical protein